jgi:hypothetical protein
MLKKLLAGGVLAVVVVVGTSLVGASAKNVKGVVTAVGDTSLQIRTKSEGTATVRLDDKTDYVKWITHKPWQADNNASLRSVDVGRCVDVGVRSDDASVAKIVRVSMDGVGTFFDPCKTMR